MMKIAAIAAMDEGRVIGIKGQLPWQLPEDMKHFSTLTKGHAVLMGVATYQSLPEKFRPLPGRKNIVLARPRVEIPGIEVWDSLEQCIDHYRSGAGKLPSEMLWVIGGAQIYRATRPYWDEVYLTAVPGQHEGDAFFPEFEADFELLSEEKAHACTFKVFRKKH
jgi:dihydrofolate reductase